MPLLTLAILTSALGYAVFSSGGVLRADWNVSLILIGSGALLYWLTRRGAAAPGIGRDLRWPLLLLPAYVLFQLLPLPVACLGVLSRARAELALSAAHVLPASGFAPLTVAPDATLDHLLRICAYISLYLLVREIASRMPRHSWAAALPLILIASAEAAFGLFDMQGSGFARGTYVNRNHFAGLLEIAFPLAVMYPISVVRRSRPAPLTPRAALIAGSGFAAAALIFAAIIQSLSRMGFLACLASLAVIGIASVPKRRRLWTIALIPVALIAAVVWLPPDALIERLATLNPAGEPSSETRIQIWADTLRLISAYPVFGCGAGAYESALLRYKTAAPLNTVDYTHNDYLQILAELGAVGFMIVAALLLALLRMLFRAGERHLRLACLASVAAILLHSLVDFNLYIPANALALAWVCGLGCRAQTGSTPSNRMRKTLRVTAVIQAQARGNS
jgi:O-antigen ligase